MLWMDLGFMVRTLQDEGAPRDRGPCQPGACGDWTGPSSETSLSMPGTGVSLVRGGGRQHRQQVGVGTERTRAKKGLPITHPNGLAVGAGLVGYAL